MEDFRALRYLAEKFYPEIPQFFYISVLSISLQRKQRARRGRHYSEAQLFTQKKDILIGNGGVVLVVFLAGAAGAAYISGKMDLLSRPSAGHGKAARAERTPEMQCSPLTAWI